MHLLEHLKDIHKINNMLLTANNLCKSVRGRKIVNNVSLYINQGEIVGLLGANGAGKTTTFNMLVGLLKCDEGDIFLENIDITKDQLWSRAQKGIGYLPQQSSIFKDLTVEDNIKLSLELKKNITKTQIEERTNELLEEFEITHVKKTYGKSLSGGERRRVEIARLLTIDPKFLLLDEPFAGVDPKAISGLQNIIITLKSKYHYGILITDHNVDETLTITDRSYLMNNGEILKHGSTEELINDENVKKTYLGENFTLKTTF